MTARRRTDVTFGPHLDGQYDVEDQLRHHIHRRSTEALAAGRLVKDAFRSASDVQARQRWLRQFAADAIGGLGPDDRSVPSARRTGTVERVGHTIDRLLLDRGDGHILTANLYLPAGGPERMPAVLFCCGHAPAGKAAPAYHHACSVLARRGFVVLAYDTIGQGERIDLLDEAGRPMIPANVPQHNHLGVKAWWAGDSSARQFISDARGALDYLMSRPEVDPDRVGALGNSGGGTMVSWLALLEPRLAAAAISCFVSGIVEIQDSGIAQDPEQIIPGGVRAGIDHDDFLLAMAPRPTLVLSKNYDFFPVEGAVRAVGHGRRAFALTGAPDHLRHVRDDGTHGLSDRLARAAAEFFGEHLGADLDTAEVVADDVPATESELQCTASGQLSTDGHPIRAIEANAVRLKESVTGSTDDHVAWLRDRVHAHRLPGTELFPRWFDTPAAGVRKVFWWPEVDLINSAVVFEPVGPSSCVDVVLLDRGTDDLPDQLSFCRNQQRAGRTVVVLDTRGMGGVTPRVDNEHGLEHHYGTLFRMASDLIALDDSLAAGRIHDLLRVLDLIADPTGLGLPATPIEITAHGHGAFLAIAAAALDPRVRRLSCLTPPFDPMSEVTEVFYGDERDAALVLPGMAKYCPMTSLVDRLGDRLRILPGTVRPLETH